jgi:hypothetical protein
MVLEMIIKLIMSCMMNSEKLSNMIILSKYYTIFIYFRNFKDI